MGNPPSSGTFIGDTLQALRAEIWKRRPILGEIMRRHGGDLLFNYAKDFMDVNRAAVLDPYKPELIDVLSELIGQRLGDDVAAKVKRQLKSFALVSTADHHATIDHPFWVNANIISALPFLEKPQPDVFSLIVLSFASVSLNNASGYPRGLLFHGGTGHSGNLIRLPLLPDKLKMSIVHSSRAYGKEDLVRAREFMQKKVSSGELLPERAEAVRGILDSLFASDDILGAPDLNSQITKINYRLWPSFFHSSSQEGSRRDTRMPDLIYFEIETLVSELLLRRHLWQRTLINRFLFDADYRRLSLQYFNNIPGAFSLEQKTGTYLFWAIDEHCHRVRLELEGNWLRSQTRPDLSVEFTPEAIAEALRRKTLYPSMLLCYVMVALYYGMKCLGGFCQVHDLTVAKEAWGKILRDIGEDREADALEPIQTKELGGDGMVLSYKKADNGELFPATGIDMAIGDWDTTVGKYVERSKTVTLDEMMNPMLPEMYTVLYASYERDPWLLTVSPERIIEETGLAEKLLRERLPSFHGFR